LKITLTSLAVALACALAVPAQAQSTQKTTKAKPAAMAKKDAKATAKAPVDAPLPPASEEQKAAAQMAHLGEYACEFDQSLNITHNAKAAGYIDVGFKKQIWVMKPVLSSTGAVRLEDVTGRMLMIQIANKSMVMDTQAGQRVVDGCMHEKQREFAKTMMPANILSK
jgi:hypothetical protein